MRIPRCVRDLQVERKSLFWDFSSQPLFHGLDLLFRQRHQELSLCAVVSDTVSCHAAGGELEQIQFLLGHVSIQTTERYLGCKQRIRSAVNDRIGIEPRG